MSMIRASAVVARVARPAIVASQGECDAYGCVDCGRQLLGRRITRI